MKLCTETKALKAALTTLSKVVRNQTTLPCLAYVKLEASEGTVKLTGTDLDTWASCELPAHLEGSGAALVSLKSLREALKPIKAGSVELELIGDSLSVGFAKLPTMPLEDYPVRGELNGDSKHFEWSAAAGEQALRLALIAATSNDSRYYLSAIQITSSHLNSTDGHRLMRVDNPSDWPFPHEFNPILVPLPLASLTARLAKHGKPIEWTYDDEFIQARIGSWTILSKYEAATQFPNSDKVMPSNGNHLECNRLELLAALQSILPFTNERSHCVKVTIADTIHLESTNTECGSACAEVNARVSGNPIAIGFNAAYLIDPLKVSDSTDVRFEWADDSGPAQLTAENWRYVIMPMRM